ncbi:uridine phosphorylase 1, partial [Wuchereria bancrofti]
MPSASIIIIELIKLLYYANAKDVVAIRMGTSGGIAIPPGTLVLTNGALNGELIDKYVQYIMGKKILRTSVFDAEVYHQLYNVAHQLQLPVQIGKTLSVNDFYE